MLLYFFKEFTNAFNNILQIFSLLFKIVGKENNTIDL